LRPVHGVLPAVAGLAAADGTHTYVVPHQNACCPLPVSAKWCRQSSRGR
jgi:hypothetical protein